MYTSLKRTRSQELEMQLSKLQKKKLLKGSPSYHSSLFLIHFYDQLMGGGRVEGAVWTQLDPSTA